MVGRSRKPIRPSHFWGRTGLPDINDPITPPAAAYDDHGWPSAAEPREKQKRPAAFLCQYIGRVMLATPPRSVQGVLMLFRPI